MQPFKVNQAGNFWAQGFAPGLDDRLEDNLDQVQRPGNKTNGFQIGRFLTPFWAESLKSQKFS